jgi:hypothetical protein
MLTCFACCAVSIYMQRCRQQLQRVPPSTMQQTCSPFEQCSSATVVLVCTEVLDRINNMRKKLNS